MHITRSRPRDVHSTETTKRRYEFGTRFDSGTAHSAVPQSNRVPNSYRLFVVSVECTSRGRDRADITVRNDGNTPMRFAKAFAVFKNKSGEVMSAQDSFFHPTDIPPGATASADVYSNGSGAYSCALLSVQDNNGIAAQLMM